MRRPVATVRHPEPDGMDTRRLTLIAVISIACLALTAALVAVLLQYSGGAPRTDTPQATARQLEARFAAPRLEPRPATTIAAVRDRERALLESYQWIDRERGVIRIPVTRAMALLVQRQSGGRP